MSAAVESNRKANPLSTETLYRQGDSEKVIVHANWKTSRESGRSINRIDTFVNNILIIIVVDVLILLLL